MAIVQCPKCGRKFQSPEKWAGTSTACLNCGGTIHLPARVIPERALIPVVDDTIETPRPIPQAAIYHHHQVAGNPFNVGFKVTLGYLAAICLVFGLLFIGCFAFGIAMGPSIERQQQLQQEQARQEVERQMQENAEMIQRVQERTYRPIRANNQGGYSR